GRRSLHDRYRPLAPLGLRSEAGRGVVPGYPSDCGLCEGAKAKEALHRQLSGVSAECPSMGGASYAMAAIRRKRKFQISDFVTTESADNADVFLSVLIRGIRGHFACPGLFSFEPSALFNLSST